MKFYMLGKKYKLFVYDLRKRKMLAYCEIETQYELKKNEKNEKERCWRMS